MVPYLLRDVTAHQLLPRFVGMQPVAQIAPATGRLLKPFGDTTVGVTVYQLHGKRPAQLTQDGNLLQIQCIVFGVAGLNRRTHEYAALGIMLQNGLNGPTGTARHGVDIYFIERLPFKGLFGTTQVTVIRSHREHKDIGRRVSATFHFGYELLDMHL